MATENTLFIGDFPIETPIGSGFPLKTFPYILVGRFNPSEK
jgi:hypothetical protein